jgi:hypothetical protein
MDYFTAAADYRQSTKIRDVPDFTLILGCLFDDRSIDCPGQAEKDQNGENIASRFGTQKG